MTRLFDQIFQLTGKFIGVIFDWPFLLFALGAWMAHRYRDQIGSMLDRRGAVSAGAIDSAVRKEIEPVVRQLDKLGPAVSELRYELERVEQDHSPAKLAKTVQPLEAKVKEVESLVSYLRAEVDRVTRKELPDQIDRARSPIQEKLKALDQTLAEQQARMGGLSSKEALQEVKTGLQSTASELTAVKEAVKALNVAAVELEALKQAIPALKSDLERRATLESTDRLSQQIQAALPAIEQLTRSMGDLETGLQSTRTGLEKRLADSIAPLSSELTGLGQAISRIDAELEAATPKDTTDRLVASFEDLSRQAATLSEVVASLDSVSKSLPMETESRITGYVAPLLQDVAAMQERLTLVQDGLTNMATRQETASIVEQLSPLKQDVGQIRQSLDEMSAATKAVAEQLETRMSAELAAVSGQIEPIRNELAGVVDAVKRALNLAQNAVTQEDAAALKGDIYGVSGDLRSTKSALEEIKSNLDATVADLNARIAGQAKPVAVDSKPSVSAAEEPAPEPKAQLANKAASGSASAEPRALVTMKRALTAGKAWKRVDKIARGAGISEEDAWKMLSAAADVSVSTDDKGKRVAKLADR